MKELAKIIRVARGHMQPDLVLKNARIVTMGETAGAEALFVQDGNLEVVGALKDMDNL